MTLEEAQAAAAALGLNLLSAGHEVCQTTGHLNDLGSISFTTPAGFVHTITFSLAGTPQEVRARAEQQYRLVMRNFELDAGRGFNNSGRGALPIGSRGYRAENGWV